MCARVCGGIAYENLRARHRVYIRISHFLIISTERCNFYLFITSAILNLHFNLDLHGATACLFAAARAVDFFISVYLLYFVCRELSVKRPGRGVRGLT